MDLDELIEWLQTMGRFLEYKYISEDQRVKLVAIKLNKNDFLSW